MNRNKFKELKEDFVEVSDELNKIHLIPNTKLNDIDWAELTPNNVIFVIAMIALVLFRFLISAFIFYLICTLLIYAFTFGNIDYPDVEKILPIDNFVTWALMIYGGYYVPIYIKEFARKRKLRKIKK
jgi:hypothetical protein